MRGENGAKYYCKIIDMKKIEFNWTNHQDMDE